MSTRSVTAPYILVYIEASQDGVPFRRSVNLFEEETVSFHGRDDLRLKMDAEDDSNFPQAARKSRETPEQSRETD